MQTFSSFGKSLRARVVQLGKRIQIDVLLATGRSEEAHEILASRARQTFTAAMNEALSNPVSRLKRKKHNIPLGGVLFGSPNADLVRDIMDTPDLIKAAVRARRMGVEMKMGYEHVDVPRLTPTIAPIKQNAAASKGVMSKSTSSKRGGRKPSRDPTRYRFLAPV